jgi:hypothetical protein
MPLLGAIGNASEYSFRGTYDNYPFDIDFGDLVDADPGQTYTTALKLVEDINYKVPISISGEGQYIIDNTVYGTEPSYIRNGNTLGLRIFGVSPNILETNLNIVDRSSTSYNVSLSSDITVGLRDGDLTFSPGGSIQFDNRTFQGSEVGIEYYDKTYTTTVTIGKKDFTWSVKTKKGSKAENLVFTDALDIGFSTEIISNIYTVQGLTNAFSYTAEIISNEGFLSVNYGQFVKSATVKNGDIVRLRVTSSNLNFTQKTITIRIYLNVSPDVQSTASWNVRTVDASPNNLSSFILPFPLELNSQTLSNVIQLSGVSPGVDFGVITSELISVNGGPFVTSSNVRNGDSLQLKVQSSSEWLEEKNYTVSITYNGLVRANTTYNTRNRTIAANIDSNAGNLIFSIPFNTINQIQDMSPEVRIKNSLSQGLRASTVIGTVAGRTSPAISTERSRSYGNIGSYKLAKGSTTKTFEVTQLRINTDQTQVLGFNDFTAEMWMWFSGLNFGGEVGMSIFYPSYIDNRNASDYFFQLFVKGDNWVNTSQFKRGLLLGYPDANGVVQTICETSSQVLSNNTWNHIALTRSGSTFRIWVNGINWASGSRSMDLTSSGYNFAIPNFQRLIPEDFYIQDLRLYKGIAKYTTSFNPLNVTPIMEPYTP